MYAELNEHNGAARFEMRQLDRQAAQAWRFRHIKSKGVQSFVTVLTSLLAFFVQ